jgi:hypothetical protein
VHPGILPDAPVVFAAVFTEVADAARRAAPGAPQLLRRRLAGGLLTGTIGQQDVVQVVLDLDPMFLHFLDGEISDRHIVLFQILNLAGQPVIRRIQAGEEWITLAQRIDGIVQFRKFLVQIMVLNVHFDFSLDLDSSQKSTV